MSREAQIGVPTKYEMMGHGGVGNLTPSSMKERPLLEVELVTFRDIDQGK
jgi:hypothetical protein